MRPHDRRSRRRSVALLAVVAFLLLGAGANGAAQAQTAPTTNLADQFGGYKLSSRGNGFLLSFDSPRLLPLGSPLFEVGLPEAQAVGANGPSGYSMASLAYPGSLIADLPAVIAQGAPDAPPFPAYPIRQQSFFPAGPATASQQIGTATMTALTSDVSSDGIAQYSGADLQAFFATGTNTVTAHTGLESGQVVSRLRSEVNGVNVLGILTIESVVTDIVANSNGTEAASDGTTTTKGVKFLGLDATLDAAGLHLGQPSEPPPSTGPLDPFLGNVDLGSLSEGLQGVAQGVSQLVASVLGSQATVNDLLAEAGISVKVLTPIATQKGAQAQRTANGVLVEIKYNGKTAPILSQLLALVPSDQLPSDSLIPQIPLNTSPQALFNLLKETFITDLALAPGDVAAQASPPFAPLPATPKVPSLPSLPISPGGSTPSGFTTPAPRLGTTGSSPGPGSVEGVLPISVNAEPLGAALVVLGLLLIGGLSGIFGGRLADNTLAAASTSCPDGRESPNATYAPGGAAP